MQNYKMFFILQKILGKILWLKIFFVPLHTDFGRMIILKTKEKVVKMTFLTLNQKNAFFGIRLIGRLAE